MESDRTFRDMNGVEWRVSHVPASTPASAIDDGWLSFAAGYLERRLAPVPKNWQASTIHRLEQMCRIATAVQRDQTAIASHRMRVGADAAPEPLVDTTPAEGSDVVAQTASALSDHVSLLANAYPARESRITFRG
jgi:hypothetical protein